MLGVDQWLETGRRHAFVGLDASTGRERWRRTTPSWIADVAAGRETALVATERDDETDPPTGYEDAPVGAIWAFTPDGGLRWRVEFETGVRAIAPVDGTVVALLKDGRVVALRTAG